MIKLGETVDRKREVNVFLADSSNPLNGITGHAWAVGEAWLCLPGGVEVAMDAGQVARFIEKLGGAYAYRLTDAEAAAGAGTVLLRYVVAGVQPNTVQEVIYDPADYGASSGGGGGGSGGGGLPAGPVTLSALENIVRLRGDYLSSITFTPSYIQHEIQAAMGELYELVADTNEGWWGKDTTLPTVAAQNWIGLPVDCWRVTGVDRLCGDRWEPLHRIAIGDRNRTTPSPGDPRKFRLSARGIELYPPPNAVYTLRITYVPQCPTLDDAHPIQLYGWEEYVITGALLRLDQREEKPLQEREAELGRQAARVIKAANERLSAEPEYLIMHGESSFDEEYGY